MIIISDIVMLTSLIGLIFYNFGIVCLYSFYCINICFEIFSSSYIYICRVIMLDLIKLILFIIILFLDLINVLR